MSTTGATWYDLLGVERDATPQQIKAAWRDATDRFEPGSGTSQFALFNQAADVLLDPTKRAEYDAGLEPETEAVPEPDPVVEQRSEERASATEPPTGAPEPVPVVEQRREERASASKPPDSERQPQASRSVPLWAVALLAVLVVAVVAVGAVFFKVNHDAGQATDAGQQASAAAERALPAVLSYDYRRLPADKTRADAFLTPTYRKEYDATFEKLIETNGSPGPAQQTKAVVKATVQNVGVVASQPGRARVIAFVNQTTTKGTAAPTLSLNRLVVSMRQIGNAWLVEDIVSY